MPLDADPPAVRRVVAVPFKQSFCIRRRKIFYGNTLHHRGCAQRAELHRSVHHCHRPVLIFGFLTNLNSNLLAKLEDIFQLEHGRPNLVTSAWFFAYLVFSVPAAKVIEKVGYKRTMVISLFVMVVGALLFVPAANMVSFPVLPYRQLRSGHRRLRIADFGQSLRFDPRPGAQRAGAAHAGAGLQFAGHGHGSDRGGRLHSDRSQQSHGPGGHRAHGAGTLYRHCMRAAGAGLHRS